MEIYLYIVKLLMYFIIYSFFGWVMESVLKTVIQKKPVNSGFLYGPFCPIYGFGAIIMFLFLQGFKEKPILLFIIAFFVLSLWEYIVGWALEKVFNTKYWDYTDNKFNISGRVCLMNSLFWGFLGVIFIRYMHPYIMERVATINQTELVILTVLLTIIMITDAIISAIKVNDISISLEKLKEITASIKDKIEELNKKQIDKESIQQAIEELKYKQTKIKRRLLRRTNRLKKAFPTMKSDAIEKINEFLKEKKENIRKSK